MKPACLREKHPAQFLIRFYNSNKNQSHSLEGWRSARLLAELFAALGAAAIDHVPATACLHAFSKTVGSFSL